jgi:hypothetical protein
MGAATPWHMHALQGTYLLVRVGGQGNPRAGAVSPLTRNWTHLPVTGVASLAHAARLGAARTPSGVGCPEAQGLPLGAPGYCPAPSLLSLADMPLAKGRAPGE